MPPQDLPEWACIYIKYIQIMRKLETSYDQTVHPQKRLDMRKALEVCTALLQHGALPVYRLILPLSCLCTALCCLVPPCTAFVLPVYRLVLHFVLPYVLPYVLPCTALYCLCTACVPLCTAFVLPVYRHVYL